jgi:hypothetical protein
MQWPVPGFRTLEVDTAVSGYEHAAREHSRYKRWLVGAVFENLCGAKNLEVVDHVDF